MWLSISVKSDEKQLMYSNPMTPNTPSYNLLQLILPDVLPPFLFFLTSHSPPGPRWWIICEILAGSLSRVDLKGDGDTNENDIYISCLQREPLSSHWSWFTKTFETVHKPDEQRLKMSNNKKKRYKSDILTNECLWRWFCAVKNCQCNLHAEKGRGLSAVNISHFTVEKSTNMINNFFRKCNINIFILIELLSFYYIYI